MYHLNYFEFMVQQRVQIAIKYVVCMGAATLLNNNTAVLFTVLTRWRMGEERDCYCGSLLCLFAVGAVLNVKIFQREVIERRAFSTVLSLTERSPLPNTHTPPQRTFISSWILQSLFCLSIRQRHHACIHPSIYCLCTRSVAHPSSVHPFPSSLCSVSPSSF